MSPAPTRSRTRLCIVLGGHWEAQMGGAQYQAKCLLDAIRARPEFETFYVACSVPERLERRGYRIVPFGFGKGRGTLGMLAQLPSLYRTLAKLRPDVVYQRCLMPYTGICALYCARHGAELVVHIARDDEARQEAARGGRGPRAILHRLMRRLAEHGLRRADAIIVQTGDQARTLAAEHGLEATLIVPNFHPVPKASVRRRGDGRLRVIWVANFKPSKNPEIFVDLAAALTARDDVEFVMAGRPGDARRYAGLHAQITRLSNLRYLGELPIERVNEEIAASDIFVNTSTTEGFPNTFIQAWMRGVPVISCGVDPDGCLSRGGAGLVASGPEDLAELIGELLDDRPRLERLGRAARAYGLSHHSPERAEPLIDLLAALAVPLAVPGLDFWTFTGHRPGHATGAAERTARTRSRGGCARGGSR